jgi:hypothetical protein
MTRDREHAVAEGPGPACVPPVAHDGEFDAPARPVASLVVVKIETVSVDVLDGELRQSPGLLFQRLNNVRTQRFQLVVRRIDIFGEHPVNRSGPNLARMEPADLKAECVPIVLLRAFDISNGQFWHRLANRR